MKKAKKWFLSLAMGLNGLLFPATRMEIAAQDVRPGRIPDVENGSAFFQHRSDRLSLVFETASQHFEEGYNWRNPGIGFEYRLNRNFHTGAGIYWNSVEAVSLYGLAGAETNGGKWLGAGVECGVVSGYDYLISPAVVPYVRLGSRDSRANLKLNFIPPTPVTPAVVACQVRVKLGSASKKIFPRAV